MVGLALRTGIPVRAWEREDPIVIETALDLLSRREE